MMWRVEKIIGKREMALIPTQKEEMWQMVVQSPFGQVLFQANSVLD